MSTEMAKDYSPLVEPHKSFLYVSLDNAQLGLEEKVIIEDPAQHFCTTQFRLMTIKEQLNLLADVAMHIKSAPQSEKTPFHVKTIEDALGAALTHERAIHYYEQKAPRALERWLQEGLVLESTREIIVERFLSDLAQQLPAIACTLAHIYNGGYYGLLTARGDRDAGHKEQIRYIGEMLGFGTPPELTYYVNDPHLGKRLEGNTATKKATILMNFATGFKQDENGNFVEMTVGKRFDEIGFIEDEAKNLKAVMHCIIRGVYTDVLDAIGWNIRTPGFEERLNKSSLSLTESAFTERGAAATTDISFWVKVVDDLLKGIKSVEDAFADRGALIHMLKQKKRWIPDVIKLYDANTMSVQPYIDSLRETFGRREPVVMGTQRSILFNDIDGTLLKVKARFPIVLKRTPEVELFSVTVEQFGLEPDQGYWLKHVAKIHNISPDELHFSFEHFRDPEIVRRDILTGCFKRHINRT